MRVSTMGPYSNIAAQSKCAMLRIAFESWRLLLYCEMVMYFREFKALLQMVVEEEMRPASAQIAAIEDLCHAIDLACVFYFKPVLCLQRSAATTLLLRRHRWPAELVIGAQLLPFKSHAWVEVEGTIVNDKPYVIDTYRVLERC